MDTNCQRTNPAATSLHCHPERRGGTRAGVLVGTCSIYTPLNEQEVMRLCWVNVGRAYRTPQLLRVYLLNVNQEHTHARVNTRAGRVYINSCSSFHLCAAAERTCADTFINLLIMYIHPFQPHLSLTFELK